MNVRVPQLNFSRGELAPQLYARFDVDAYNAAVRKAYNVVVLKYGGLTKRPGFRLIGEVLDASKPTRIIPFQFSLEQTYALEMGQGYMAPCAMGGRVLEEELAVSGITNATQAVVTVAYHALSVGDWWFFSGIKGDMGALVNGRAFKVVAVIDANNFRLDCDTMGGAPFSGSDGGITRSGPPVVPVAPVVPPVVTPPDPPVVGGGGGGSFKGTQRF